MQEEVTKCFGWVSQYNPLSMQPGALVKAENCAIRRENVIEDRRGYKEYGDVDNTPKQLMYYNNLVLVHHSNKIAYDNGSGTFADYSGTYDEIANKKIRYEIAKNNLLFTTDEGIKIFTDVAGTAARSAGVDRCLDPSYTLTSVSAGFLQNGYQCAYRAMIYKIDANNNVVFGYPSQRLWAINASGNDESVNLTVYLPTSVEEGDEIRFFRTVTVSGTTSDDSGDEMALVLAYEVTATDVSNGYVAVTDTVDDDLRGEELYTNPSQEGIAQGNNQPPLAEDIASYKSSFMFYANTESRQRLFMTLVGTSGLSGKNITIAGTTYEFGATEIISGGGAPQAKVSATGAAAFDIDETARSLVRVINRYASNTSVYAYYLSGPDDLPGDILIEARTLGSNAFTAQAEDSTIGGMFTPFLPTSPATSAKATSSNDDNGNYLYYSKADQPEHVPALNYIPVGAANQDILRIAPLRDSLIIIKEEGVYRLTGEDVNSFTVVPLDLTVKCLAPSSVAVLNNQVFMLSNQGVVSISDTGVDTVSRAIEPEILPLLSFAYLETACYGVGYNSDRSYILSLPSVSGDEVPTQTFYYNTYTKTWAKWTFGFVAGIVDDVADKWYLTKDSFSKVYIERKDYDASDFADPEYAVTITSIDDQTVVFTSTTTPAVGDKLSQNSTNIKITSVSSNGNTRTVTIASTAPASWTTGAATIYPGVDMDIEWSVWFGPKKGGQKQVREVAILTDNIQGQSNTSSLTVTFRTDMNQVREEVAIDSGAYGWGDGPWGEFPWGGIQDPFGYRTFVPRNSQYCRIMNAGVKMNNAQEKVSITGISYVFRDISERFRR